MHGIIVIGRQKKKNANRSEIMLLRTFGASRKRINTFIDWFLSVDYEKVNVTPVRLFFIQIHLVSSFQRSCCAIVPSLVPCHELLTNIMFVQIQTFVWDSYFGFRVDVW